ncbi:MAG: N-acetylmuramoyl-L-alanine amidase-like domain-containing protein [Myxococcota bacterium]|nr:N-acetylmuramoyl-L-alanine amidase-like domain-containing protein [Myxococcota bacterium]
MESVTRQKANKRTSWKAFCGAFIFLFGISLGSTQSRANPRNHAQNSTSKKRIKTKKIELNPRNNRPIVRKWFRKVGKRQPNESFGELMARVAIMKLRRPYLNKPTHAVKEKLRPNVQSFECVSLVETSLAMARCVWTSQPNYRCFKSELQQCRYRNGAIANYGSRLHYFTDWLQDNATRQRVKLLSQDLGGIPNQRSFNRMTTRVRAYPALKNKGVFNQIRDAEYRLNKTKVFWIPKDQVQAIQPQLSAGDIIGIVTKMKGLLLSHVGLLIPNQKNGPRLLHASSFHGRVVLTRVSLHNYLHRQAKRLGIVVARPLAPTSKLAEHFPK